MKDVHSQTSLCTLVGLDGPCTNSQKIMEQFTSKKVICPYINANVCNWPQDRVAATEFIQCFKNRILSYRFAVMTLCIPLTL